MTLGCQVQIKGLGSLLPKRAGPYFLVATHAYVRYGFGARTLHQMSYEIPVAQHRGLRLVLC
jgi:hypothetical protein